MIEICKSLVKIEFNKQFYDIGSIKESLKRFKNVCASSIKDGKNVEVELKPKEKSLKNIIGYEFCNYVLGLMKTKARI